MPERAFRIQPLRMRLKPELLFVPDCPGKGGIAENQAGRDFQNRFMGRRIVDFRDKLSDRNGNHVAPLLHLE